MSISAGDKGKFKVFVSYCRDDLQTTDDLLFGLGEKGFDATWDVKDIEPGEAWQERIGTLILEADTVVIPLSPAWTASTACAWELSEAERLGKRILPVVITPLDGAAVPDGLQARNYIYYYFDPKHPDSGPIKGLSKLTDRLKKDLDWHREGTRLLLRAEEWQKGGRTAERLLLGRDVAEARLWRERHC